MMQGHRRMADTHPISSSSNVLPTFSVLTISFIRFPSFEIPAFYAFSIMQSDSTLSAVTEECADDSNSYSNFMKLDLDLIDSNKHKP